MGLARRGDAQKLAATQSLLPLMGEGDRKNPPLVSPVIAVIPNSEVLTCGRWRQHMLGLIRQGKGTVLSVRKPRFPTTLVFSATLITCTTATLCLFEAQPPQGEKGRRRVFVYASLMNEGQ